MLKASIGGAGAGMAMAALLSANAAEKLWGKIFLVLSPLFAVILSAVFEWVLISMERLSRAKKAKIRHGLVQGMLTQASLTPERKEQLDQELIEIQNEALRWGFTLN
ncbi:hypothetical protein [Streptomyces sp. WAC08452]|uniref:hypothetical protein n=1 Tax=Streptomyces sp. WAC08452 TaxID=2487414 RepID=UPI000F93E9AF|nr:hypothetical protein [Streptomyces sp. WAC08452]RSS21777.1 hypothetical protein EF916_33725 [Streptomyces sp. WAC08452]